MEMAWKLHFRYFPDQVWGRKANVTIPHVTLANFAQKSLCWPESEGANQAQNLASYPVVRTQH